MRPAYIYVYTHRMREWARERERETRCDLREKVIDPPHVGARMCITRSRNLPFSRASVSAI